MEIWQLSQSVLPLTAHTLRYEDVVESFEDRVNELLSFLNLSWDDSIFSFHRHAMQRPINTPSYEQVKLIYQDSLNRWHNYRTFMAPLAPTLDPFVRALGYTDHNAVGGLPMDQIS